jgi:hemerythrin
VPFAWDPSYAVGHPTIDKQHQELFARMNALLGAMQARHGQEEVDKLLAFLSSYVVHHFGAEEALMRRHGYAGMAAHVAEHQGFEAELRRMADNYRKSGASASMVIALNHRLRDWLLGHVGRMDTQLAAFLARAA